MKHYQLIVFDWDGTLVDSTGHIVHCIKLASKQLALPPVKDNAISHVIGLSLTEAIKTLYPNIDYQTAQSLADKYRKIWLNTPQHIPLFSHAYQLIKSLHKQQHFLGIATGKSRQGLDKALASTGLELFFHATRCADECRSKPDPQMIEQLIAYFDADPSQTLMIGDTAFDLQMAHAAGADSLAVKHGAHDIKALQACQPKMIVDNLYQAEKWLQTPRA